MKLPEDKQNSLIDLYLEDPNSLCPSYLLPGTDEEISEFVQIASHNKASAQLYLQLNRLSSQLSIPEALLSPLRKTYEQVREKNLKRLETGVPVLLELQKRSVQVIILKGNAIAEDLYLDIGYKPMNDIDILIKKQDLEIVHDVFRDFDLLTAAPLDEDSRKQEKFSHHLPPYFDKKLNVFFGTHWDIATPLRGIKSPIEKFWEEKEEFKLLGKSFYRLKPEHFIFHLCVHLSMAKTGLREVADIVRMIEAHKHRLRSEEFIAIVQNADASVDVYEALFLAHALRPSEFAADVLKHLSVDVKIRERVKFRISPRSKLLHIRTNYISKIEKTFAMFMITEDPREKTLLLAKMWKLFLLIPQEDALRLSYEMPDSNLLTKLISCLKAPLKVSEVFIKDLGLPIFIIVTMRHQWVLFKAYLNYLSLKLQGKKIEDLESFAKKLGLTFDEIKEISSLD